MNILIDKIRVRSFRALKDVEINLRPVTVLVGTNNSGKTTVLRALNSVLGIARNPINQDDLFVNKSGENNSRVITIDIRIVPVNGQGNRIPEFSIEWNSKLGFVVVQLEKDYQYIAFRTIYNFNLEDSPVVSNRAISNWETEQLHNEELKGINQIRNNIKMYFIDAQRDILEDSLQRGSFFGKLVAQLEYGDNLKSIQQQIDELNLMAIDSSPALQHLTAELKKLNQATRTQGKRRQLKPLSEKN